MKLLSVILVSILLLFLYAIFYVSFDICLSADVDYRFGKSQLKKRKKVKSFWKKFLFLDIKDKAIKWHYVLFWMNFVSFVLLLFLVNFSLLFETSRFHKLIIIFIIIFVSSDIPIAFSRFVFNNLNISRNTNKRRKIERLSKREKAKFKNARRYTETGDNPRKSHKGRRKDGTKI